MRFDMHCHTRYGSIDSKVSICDYIDMLKEKNYDGMLVTDHDSYKGYDKWYKANSNNIKDFIVLRGVEYDTRDAGHFLVILPDGIHLKALSTPPEAVLRIRHGLNCRPCSSATGVLMFQYQDAKIYA